MRGFSLARLPPGMGGMRPRPQHRCRSTSAASSGAGSAPVSLATQSMFNVELSTRWGALPLIRKHVFFDTGSGECVPEGSHHMRRAEHGWGPAGSDAHQAACAGELNCLHSSWCCCAERQLWLPRTYCYLMKSRLSHCPKYQMQGCDMGTEDNSATAYRQRVGASLQHLDAQFAFSSMQNQGLSGKDVDFVRTARMATFGLLFYGPLQHRWYGLLASRFPGTSTQNFLSKARSCSYCMHCLLL